ncbi:MAG: lipid-A-disaccharide synthase [Alphaproteobacteria bacterium]|nr:lipid-A-disaccharide synthase [Alphaproteobacteria bacterium]
MRNKKYKIFIIAGEVSGDVLGARIMVEMPDAEFIGIGGENMRQVGLQSIFPMSDLAVMGAIEVLAHARTLTRRIRQTVDAIIDTKPDLVLTIDSPGFARRVITAARKRGANTRFYHFVAPQVWAWRPGRAKKYAKTFDKLYAFFDFEVPYFTRYNLTTVAVGHPLADLLICNQPTAVGMTKREKIITIIPGSRMSEVKRLLPIFRDAVQMMVHCGYYNYKYVIPTVETTADYIAEHVKHWTVQPELIPATARYDVYAKTYVAIAASGTVSAELAMMHIPAIIVYKMNPITTWIVRQMIRVKWVSLVNILMNRGIYSELLGPAANVQNIMNEFCKLAIPANREKMIADLAAADKMWQPNKNGACAAVARDIRNSIKQ